MHTELVGEADPAEKLVKSWGFFSLDYFSAESKADAIVRALAVLMAAECGVIKWLRGTGGALGEDCSL